MGRGGGWAGKWEGGGRQAKFTPLFRGVRKVLLWIWGRVGGGGGGGGGGDKKV